MAHRSTTGSWKVRVQSSQQQEVQGTLAALQIGRPLESSQLHGGLDLP